MLTYDQMSVLMQHLTNGVLKASDQTDLNTTYTLVGMGLLQQVGAVKMWVVTKAGAEMALRNRLTWKLMNAATALFRLSDDKRDRLFYNVCKF